VVGDQITEINVGRLSVPIYSVPIAVPRFDVLRVHISFNISKTTCYIEVSITLKWNC